MARIRAPAAVTDPTVKSPLLTAVVVLALAPRVARGEECHIAVVLDGDGALVDAIDATLNQRGIATKATAACPTTTALVERRDNAIAVTITDPSGRRSTRRLDDVDAASSLIETWARQDINASALIGWTEPDPAAPIVDAPRVDTARAASVAPSRGARPRDPITLTVAGETSVDFAAATWLGARANACVRIGPACAGATARISSHDSLRSIDVLVGAELPVAMTSRVVLVTGVAAGAGSFRSSYVRGEATTDVSKVGLRVDAHAALAVSLARHVGLHLGISVGGSPQAPMTISTAGDAPVDNGEPRGFVRADVGLRIGVP